MRHLLLYVFSSVLVFSGAAQAGRSCHSIYTPPSFIHGVSIRPEPGFEISQLNLHPTELSSDRKAALEQLMHMKSQTSEFRIIPKDTTDKNELVLALGLEKGYVLELKYESKSQVQPTYVLQTISMVSPTSSKSLTKDALDFNAFRLKQDRFTLDGTYPPGFEIDAQVMLKIDGGVLQEFTNKILARLPLFEKSELKKMSEAQQLSRWRWISHIRAAKQTVKEALFSQASVRKIIFYTPIVVATLYSPSVSMKPQVETPAVTPRESVQWISEMSMGLGVMAGHGAAAEVMNLNRQISDQLARSSSTKVSPDLSKPGVKIGDSSFAWLVEKQGNRRTFIVFSRDTAKGAIEYFSMEINPAQYPLLVKALTTNGSKVEMN